MNVKGEVIAWKAPVSPPKARELSKGHTWSMTFLVKKGAYTLQAAFSAANAEARAKGSESSRRRDNGVHNCTRAGWPFSAHASKSMRLERAVKNRGRGLAPPARSTSKSNYELFNCNNFNMMTEIDSYG